MLRQIAEQELPKLMEKYGANSTNNKPTITMGLLKRTWNYGEIIDVEVESASRALITVVAPDINEGFLLAGHGVADLPKKGDKGTITFTKGGPTGGYWKWQPKTI